MFMQIQEKKNVRAIFLFFLALSACWAVIQPVYGIADEPEHVVKALAVAHGTLSGPRTTGQNGYAAMEFKVPEAYSNTTLWHCYTGNADFSPTCTDSFMSRSSKTVPVVSSAAEYPPLYYGLVGWAGWLFPGPWGILAMRLITALACSALMALTALVFVLHKRYVGLVTLLVAATPMMFSFAGSVNPFAPESAAAFLYWATSLSLCNQSDHQPHRKILIPLLYLAGFLFGIIRPGSFVWIIPVTFIVALTSISKLSDLRVSHFWHSTRHVLTSGLIGTLISISWFIFGMKNRNLGGSSQPVGGHILSNMRVSFEKTDDFLRQMYGTFGWLELGAPVAVPLLLFALLVVIYARAEPLATQVRVPLILTTIVVIFGPTFLEGARASTSGWGFQGRYILPIAIGIPMMIASRTRPQQKQIYPLYIIAMIAMIAQAIALNHAMRRYFTGLSKPYLWVFHMSWEGIVGPQVTLISILLVFVSSIYLMLQLRSLESQSMDLTANN